LYGGEPGGERSGVVLGEYPEEPLDRAEEGSVDHDRLVALAVGAGVGDAEPLRGLEVELDRRHLPVAADCVAHLHGDLRTVERAATLVAHQLEAAGLADPAEDLGGLVPLLDGSD